MTADTISFEGYHLPGLQAGAEELQLDLDLTLPATGRTDHFVSPPLRLEVSSPRFLFSPSEIHAVFPPRDSLGEWDNVLPHIELMPSTLPWKRPSGVNNPAVPWLALILLQDDEWVDVDQVPAEDIDAQVAAGTRQSPPVRAQKVPWETLRSDLGLTAEVTDRPAEEGKRFPPVQALRFEPSFLEQILPTDDDLRWLTHVRVGHDAHGQEVERAVVVCNRMPRRGARAAVHLVSLEQRFKNNDTFDFRAAADGRIPLLSIHSWQFTCPADEQFKVSDKAIGRLDEPLKTNVAQRFATDEARDQLYRGRAAFMDALSGFEATETEVLADACRIESETFKGLMDALDLSWFHVPKKDGQHGLFEIGSVPVAHGLQHGGKTVSWYHGPLIADKNLDADIERRLMQTLPIRHSEQLLLYNATSRMLDASYAAAWEVGRLLSISEPRISQQIAQWKSSHAREAALVEQNMWISHIPFTDSQFVHREGSEIEHNLQSYFTDLSRLHGVPFQYLVPHEHLLPDESLRFFYVDPLWVECLLDGAFSIGRTTRFDLERELGASGQFPHQQERPVLSGILLRSDLVAGWPSLMVEGYGSAEASSEQRLKLLRYEKLGSGVAMAIFEGQVEAVTVHLPPESLHFGLSRRVSAVSEYAKEVKNPIDGNELSVVQDDSSKTRVELGWRSGAEDLRIWDRKAMVRDLNRCLETEARQRNIAFDKITHSGQLALQLLEGVPRLLVTRRRA